MTGTTRRLATIRAGERPVFGPILPILGYRSIDDALSTGLDFAWEFTGQVWADIFPTGIVKKCPNPAPIPSLGSIKF